MTELILETPKFDNPAETFMYQCLLDSLGSLCFVVHDERFGLLFTEPMVDNIGRCIMELARS